MADIYPLLCQERLTQAIVIKMRVAGLQVAVKTLQQNIT